MDYEACIQLSLPWMLMLMVIVLVKVEREVIDKLDELICHGRGDDEYKQLFTTMYVQTTICFPFEINI